MEDSNKINREIVIMVIMVIILILSLLGILLYEVYKNKDNSNINNNITSSTIITTKLNSDNIIHSYLDNLVRIGNIIDYNIVDSKSVLKSDICSDKVYSDDSEFYSVFIEYKKSDIDYTFSNNDILVNDNVYRSKVIFVINTGEVFDIIEQC